MRRMNATAAQARAISTAITTTKHWLFAAVLVGAMMALTPSALAQPTDLIISEYIEGSSNNKGLEFYNGTGSAIDLALGGYKVELYFNGQTVAATTINLTGMIAASSTYVLAHGTATFAGSAQQTHNNLTFNGDDAIVLKKGSVTIDSLGQVGFDPGTEWGSGLTSTADNTLQRKANICAGDTDPNDAFDPSLEWNGFTQDWAQGLGSHSVQCSQLPAVTSVSLSGGPTYLVGDSATVTATLSAAPQADEPATISVSSPAFASDIIINIANPATSGTATATLSNAGDDQVATATGTTNAVGSAQSVPFDVLPNAPSCMLAPSSAFHAFGSQASVTVTVTNQGQPAEEVNVNFEVTAGPNAGTMGAVVTNASGQATFTYTGTSQSGTDTVAAGGTIGGSPFSCTATRTWYTSATLVINELDADTPGTDAAEFIELYNVSGGSTGLDGLFIAFYNGTTDASYATFDLDGKSTNADGYFVMGNQAVVDALVQSGQFTTNNVFVFNGNALQNGEDAAAVHVGNAPMSSIPPTAFPLLDAVVYDTSDPDDPGLINNLTPGQPQINESGGGDSTAHSIQRCTDGAGGPLVTSTFMQSTPTAGAPNSYATIPSTVTTVPATICAGDGAMLNATGFGTDEAIDWYSGSCGGLLVGTGSPLAVNPSATTTYYARRRNTISNCSSINCGSVTLTVITPSTYYLDNDNDGYGQTEMTVQACSEPDGYAPLPGDCNDGNANINPGVASDGCNGIDDNCNGDTDENADCDDGIPCTIDACIDGVCTHTLDNAACDDGDPCTIDSCDPLLGCLNIASPDSDGDGMCDTVDACPNDPDNDIDRDGLCGDADNCPAVWNADQADSDGDGVGDACDTGGGKLSATIEIDGMEGAGVMRCLRFTFINSSTSATETVSVLATFNSGAASIEVPVDCAKYDCVLVSDPLHTLVRAAPLDSETCEIALTGASALVAGNLNDDAFIDILDFGIYIGRYGTMPGPHSACAPTPAPGNGGGFHADFSGDGIVGTEDFTFIAVAFLQHSDEACGPPQGGVAGANAPGGLQEISVPDLIAMGLPWLVTADLNGDGWLNAQDIAVMMAAPALEPVTVAVFTGEAGSDDWFDGANWSTGSPPTAGQHVVSIRPMVARHAVDARGRSVAAQAMDVRLYAGAELQIIAPGSGPENGGGAGGGAMLSARSMLVLPGAQVFVGAAGAGGGGARLDVLERCVIDGRLAVTDGSTLQAMQIDVGAGGELAGGAGGGVGGTIVGDVVVGADGLLEVENGLRIIGDLALSPGAAVRFDLGPGKPGSRIGSSLIIDGVAQLDGEAVITRPAATPVALLVGQRLLLMEATVAGAIDGTFASVTVEGGPSGWPHGLTARLMYEPLRVWLVIEEPPGTAAIGAE